VNPSFNNGYSGTSLNLVSIVRTRKRPNRNQIHRTVFKSLNLIGGINRAVSEGDKVLIKPNAGSETTWEKGAVTNPYVVEAVTKKVFEAGAQDVIIGEASQIGTDTKKVFEINNYTEIAENTGAKLVDLNEEEHVSVAVEGKLLKKVRVFKAALDCDVIISVPVVKTHVLTGITLSLKNMKGVIPVSEKKKFHLLGLDNAIADLQLAVKPDLTVVDCLLAMGGLGAPVHLSKPVEPGLVLAGFNPVMVDAITCKVIGISPYDIKHLVYANEHNLGSLDISDVELNGENLENVTFNLEKPSYELKEFQDTNLNISQDGACSGCIGALYSALKICKKTGELNNLPKASFSIGTQAITHDYEGVKILIGKCQNKTGVNGKHVPGCPPLVIQIRDEIRTLIGLARISV
jgi:uncharacterized protein (DUF362 family)